MACWLISYKLLSNKSPLGRKTSFLWNVGWVLKGGAGGGLASQEGGWLLRGFQKCLGTWQRWAEVHSVAQEGRRDHSAALVFARCRGPEGQAPGCCAETGLPRPSCRPVCPSPPQEALEGHLPVHCWHSVWPGHRWHRAADP